VIGDDVPTARRVRAVGQRDKLVLGVSRRSRLSAALTGPGIGATVIRESGDIDVHIVTHPPPADASPCRARAAR
jgi:two-component system sensor histidine kinase KdpD